MLNKILIINYFDNSTLYSSQHKKQQQMKKASHEQPSTDGIEVPHPNQDEETKVSLDTIPNLNNESSGSPHTENSDSVQHTDVENLNDPILPQTTPLVSIFFN